MANEEVKKDETEKERGEMPKWAEQLQNSIKALSEKLTETQTRQTEPQQTEPVVEVPVPPVPQETETEQENYEEEVTEQTTMKEKKKFLDWLL